MNSWDKILKTDELTHEKKKYKIGVRQFIESTNWIVAYVNDIILIVRSIKSLENAIIVRAIENWANRVEIKAKFVE